MPALNQFYALPDNFLGWQGTDVAYHSYFGTKTNTYMDMHSEGFGTFLQFTEDVC